MRPYSSGLNDLDQGNVYQHMLNISGANMALSLWQNGRKKPDVVPFATPPVNGAREDALSD